MAAVRALPAAAVGAEGADPPGDELDLDVQIATLAEAHDTLRRQLSSIDR